MKTNTNESKEVCRYREYALNGLLTLLSVEFNPRTDTIITAYGIGKREAKGLVATFQDLPVSEDEVIVLESPVNKDSIAELTLDWSY